MAGFYNTQQAAAKLNKSEDDLRKLVRDGMLREFRDAGGAAYKADEVDALARNLAGGDEIGLLDSAAGTLATTSARPTKPGSPAPETAKGDTSVFSLDAAAAEKDAAKTDVFSLEAAGESGDERKSGSGSGSSISLLDDLENITIPADPMAETVVSSEGIEGTPGGSGLMDLARESDDTSLGAELYDESGEAEAHPAGASGTGSAIVAAEPVAASATEYYVAPRPGYEAADPMTPAFIAMSAIGLVALLLTGMAVSSSVQDSWPGLLDVLYKNILYYLLGGLVAAGAAFGIGFLVVRQGQARRGAMGRAGTAGEAVAHEG